MKQALQCRDFHPIKDELTALARFWAERLPLYDDERTVTPEYLFVMERLNRIMEVLGKDLFSAIMEDVPKTHRVRRRDRDALENGACIEDFG